jgi:tRNA threonylcarbamoyladenosine biosynthesis protein TsaB
MRVLAVETSAKVASVAIWEETGLLCEFTTNHKLTHSQQLLPMIDSALKSVSMKLDDIDIFAVAEGPGSFTGLRIGITTVKAFSYTLEKPVITVNTLDALAYNISPDLNNVCSMLDARNNQVFSGIYRPVKGEYTLIEDYLAIEIYDLIRKIKELNIITAFVGDAVVMHQKTLAKELGNLCFFPPLCNTYQRGSIIGFLALKKYREGKVSDCISALPFYLRKSQAEQLLERKKE